MRDHSVVDEQGDLTDKVELALDVFLPVRLFVHLFVIEFAILLVIVLREVVRRVRVVLFALVFLLIVRVFVVLPAGGLFGLGLLDFLLLIRFDHENLALGVLLEVLKEDVCETNQVLEVLLIVLTWREELEAEVDDFDNVVPEHVILQNVRILAVLFALFVLVGAGTHALDEQENLREKLHRGVELSICDFGVLFLCLGYAASVHRAEEEVKAVKLE